MEYGINEMTGDMIGSFHEVGSQYQSQGHNELCVGKHRPTAKTRYLHLAQMQYQILNN